jgi:hypothetical protein
MLRDLMTRYPVDLAAAQTAEKVAASDIFGASGRP